MKRPPFIAWILLQTCFLILPAALADSSGQPTITVGSKAFTEGVILGEIAKQLADGSGANAVHKRELGGTRVMWSALTNGDIDVYAEYTGTLTQEIFANRSIKNELELNTALKKFGIKMTQPLGFNNTYVLGMKESQAEKFGIQAISDLQNYPAMRFGFSNEFMDRADGWPGLKKHYALPQDKVAGLDHALAYHGLDSGTLDVIDLYSTDAEIRYYQLRTLHDDKNYFPSYYAVYLYREALEVEAPGFITVLKKLERRINENKMVALNAQAKIDRISEQQVAAEFIEKELGIINKTRSESSVVRLLRNTKDHLYLVLLSLSAAIVIAIPLGITAAKKPRMGQIILGVAGILQTIPSLALFVFMIPLVGIGGPPAMMALFLYSLLPIIRNTYSGLHDIPTTTRESAIAIGLSPGARLRMIELPLATRSILAGIKTSAVINVGTATLGALIGAGGYGQPILTGIRLDDFGLILQGAIPAAILALLVQGIFELVERVMLPSSLRYQNVIQR
jgi:osmoprotectant transport system permease protein